MTVDPTPAPLAAWHHVVRSRDPAALLALLDDDVVFHSPVVHTPQRGKAITFKYLMGAMQVLNTAQFRYERELFGPHDALLEFSTEIDGLQVNGIDLIRWNDAGRIVDFKVMVRPLKAVNLVHQKMGEMLERLGRPAAP
jgi:SnoaL-like domain